MTTKVLTIGSAPSCDFQISEVAMPLIDSCYFQDVLPVHVQIVEENCNQYYLLPFSNNICINNKPIATFYSDNILETDRTRHKAIRLGVEDKISIGIFDFFWQQWMAGLGLRCDKCGYNQLRQPNDEWCQYCERTYHNPSPYINGYSSKFAEDKRFYNYTDCNQCRLKPDWCAECTFHQEPEPLNRSYKEHVNMYLHRLARPAKP